MADKKTAEKAIKEKEEKKQLIIQTAQSFITLSSDNKNFILGYMLGVQQSKEKIHGK